VSGTGDDAPPSPSRRLNFAQRTVLVVAVGVVIAALVVSINDSVWFGNGEWFNYAPNSGVLYTASDIHASFNRVWPEMLWWLGGTLAWAAFAIWIYRDPAARSPQPADD
jgi:hypothetical protein